MKKYTKGFISIGFIIAIILALGVVGGVSYYSVQQKAKERQKENIISQNFIKGTWIHAQEEDTEGNLVYRNSEAYTPSSVRFRHYIIFKENNICSSLQLAPNDAHYLKDVNCSLTTDSGITFLNLDNEKYRIINQSESKIVLQKIEDNSEIISGGGQQYCSKDLDCACGVNIETRSCFLGNKEYVDTSKQCPDFCSGYSGNLTIKCMNNLCKQVPFPITE
ncbi:MAG: hypothetical protein WDK96_02190 [Candidatus Paceibacterota bacterium]|jgi:hypothetical protein